mmetsp:Transcript_114190/g.323383  ORF Transcript_114190/g.323383 Transcript_114190/m.323383 type:complete len:213 (+) Transcript_114190:89-727(+)
MFDYDEIETIDPSPAVRLNFEIDEKVFPVKAPTMRLPGTAGTAVGARPSATAQGGPEDLLRMFVRHSSTTPQEVYEIWEKEWKVHYASRLKFLAPPGSERKYLNPRLDTLPVHPEVTRLEGLPSILTALYAAFKRHDPMLAREREELEVKATRDEAEREELRLRHARMTQEACHGEVGATLEERRVRMEDAARRLTESFAPRRGEGEGGAGP